MVSAKNIYRLGMKDLWGLARDPLLILFVVYTFTFSIYSSATAVPDAVHRASIAVVDEDLSPLSKRIISAYYPPHFLNPFRIELSQVNQGMDQGIFTFALNIPPNFQRDVLRGDSPEIQLNVDATRMSQAFVGSGYVSQIALDEVREFVDRYRSQPAPPVDLAIRMRFNPNLTPSWFGAVVEVINQITMLSIILTGAAFLREREHGTIEHLLVMPVTPTEIMLSKIWSMGLVVLVAAALSLVFIVEDALKVPIQGSLWLFLCGAALHLFAATSMGILLATLARSMPQFGMLLLLVLLPMQMLSGGDTPRENMPELVQNIMLAAPTTHFVKIGQAVLFRGAGFGIVWPSFTALLLTGAVFFAIAKARFWKTLSRLG